MAELEGLQSAGEAAEWAHRGLPAKNTLKAEDAELVEMGFRAKLEGLGDQPRFNPSRLGSGLLSKAELRIRSSRLCRRNVLGAKTAGLCREHRIARSTI
jgi:hypothetical protein